MVLRSRAAALAGLVGGFCALAGVVASGALTSLDQYAVDHWMPELEPGGETTPAISVHQLYPHVGTFPRGFFNVWTFPASSFFSAAVLAGCAAVLVRRGQRTAALVWVAAWIGANAVEVVGKTALHRPALHATVAGATLPLRSFDHSFPSGHAVRAVVIVAVLAAGWRRAVWPG